MRFRHFTPVAAVLVALVPSLIAPSFAPALRGDSSAPLRKAVTGRQAEGMPDAFGYSLAISGDTLVVGARTLGTDVGSVFPGAAFVYARSGGSWRLEQELSASDGASGDGFGEAVGIDGDTIVVGANYHLNPRGDNAGAAYVFTRSADGWTQAAELRASDGDHGDEFGAAVAVSGSTILVGAHLATDDWGEVTGAAYVFSGSGGAWAQQTKMTAWDGGYYEHFASCVALDRDTALIGANGHDVWGMDWVGAGYVYVRSGGVWKLQQELNPDESTEGQNIGRAVALEGDTAILGGPQEYVRPDNVGHAYVFHRSGATWTEEAHLRASDATDNDGFGGAAALSGDRVLVGACNQDVLGVEDAGAVYSFTRAGAGWTEDARFFIKGASRRDMFGYSVALSQATAVVGEPWFTGGGRPDSGVAWTFEHKGASWANGVKLPRPGSSSTDPVVVLVGGLSSKYAGERTDRAGGDWSFVKKRLEGDGYDVYVAATWPHAASGADPDAIDSESGAWGESAKRLDHQLVQAGLNGRPIILVGHSMGGLIARVYARDWRTYASACRPLGIIQLGTPNKGSRLANVPAWFGDSQAADKLADGDAMAKFNDDYPNREGLPIYRLAGAYFPTSAYALALTRPGLGLVYDGIITLFQNQANDSAVTVDSVRGGPTAGWRGCATFKAVHANSKWLLSFRDAAGCILPRRSGTKGAALVDERIMERIITDVSILSDEAALGTSGLGSAVAAGSARRER